MSRSLKTGTRRRLRTSAALLALATATIGGAAAAPAIANGVAPSATGSGHVTVEGEFRTFAFSAVTHQDGSVTGQSQVNNRSLRVAQHVAISCLDVVGTTAYVSGTVTQSSDPTRVGQAVVFAVRDNGAGANSAPDLISLQNHYPGANAARLCQLVHPTLEFPIEGGNVSVHQ